MSVTGGVVPPDNSYNEVCLNLFGQPEQNTTDWVVYKQQKFTSHSSRGWEVQDQGAGIFSV